MDRRQPLLVVPIFSFLSWRAPPVDSLRRLAVAQQLFGRLAAQAAVSNYLARVSFLLLRNLPSPTLAGVRLGKTDIHPQNDPDREERQALRASHRM